MTLRTGWGMGARKKLMHSQRGAADAGTAEGRSLAPAKSGSSC
eukprot:CAMPEP_0174297540 /NCGR_PEP_ID=MMETSP0809-20121228/51323_1 /TAXON_ID=73025 ORGANISM="Eutreptiella gymnastica-like, Strain CCMP1594" /NCGR_SAMPLE_ID=MMETSP0809 /ASSEMBLY_ACC=CAM_ASM_000658 /LENGTH=42 /DNA_ID= /DNA_START= /DNA_END= /DNA_ORIENTATION=